MKKKGFTLVEMIGVITVLAIISAIVIPMIVNQVRLRKTQIEQAFLDTINAASVSYMNRNKKNFVGQINSCIKISTLVDNNLLDSSIYDYDELGFDLKDAYVLTKSYDREASIGLSCSPIYNTYNNGTAIYFNPETATLCNNPVSATGVKTGCMKWYIFNDLSSSSTVNMILDHNTTAVSDVSSLSNKLTSDTSSWFIDIKATARLISADEVAKIVGADDALSWSSSKSYTSGSPIKGTNISSFYFDGAYGNDNTWKTMVANVRGASKYSWLYDYTKCLDGTTYTGCNILDTNTYDFSTYTNVYIQGYWTSTTLTGDSSSTWKVDLHGSLIPGSNSDSDKNGIRPVISIPKTIIK